MVGSKKNRASLKKEYLSSPEGYSFHHWVVVQYDKMYIEALKHGETSKTLREYIKNCKKRYKAVTGNRVSTIDLLFLIRKGEIYFK